MTTKNNKLPLFVPSDFDATVGTFFDGFSKILVAIAVLSGTLCISSDVIFGTMMPGIGLGVLLLNGFFWYDARREAKKRNQPGLVAVPAGLQAGRIFIWLFSIMVPVYVSTGDAMLAFKTEVQAEFEKILSAKIENNLSDAALGKLIHAVVSDEDVKNYAVEVSEVNDSLKAELAEEIKNGLEIRPTKGVRAGFRLAAKDGSGYFDCSDDEIMQMLMPYFRDLDF